MRVVATLFLTFFVFGFFCLRGRAGRYHGREEGRTGGERGDGRYRLECR